MEAQLRICSSFLSDALLLSLTLGGGDLSLGAAAQGPPSPKGA